MTELTTELQKSDKVLKIKLTGKINEEAQFEPIDFQKFQEVHFDLQGVTSINSIGVRTWLRLIGSIPKNSKIQLWKVPKILIDQANMIRGFFPAHSFVNTFEVPYYCPHCENVTRTMIENLGEATKAKVQDHSVCEKCGKASEIDVLKDSFFKFLQNDRL